MEYKGVLKKMSTEHTDKVQYYLEMPSDILHINQLLNKEITITLEGFECLSCHDSKEIFAQGFCKNCFFTKPSAGEWIINPELSKAHLGIEDRDLEFEKAMQLQPHIVYLANSSNVKVGVTKKSQVPTRWIDQGAHEAIEIVEVPNRYLAGITEVALKQHVSDKTNWRTMLKNEIKDADLLEWRERLLQYIPDEAKAYIIENNKETAITFPVEEYPVKIKSLNLKKEKTFKGKLVGIKAQYLIFEGGIVFNVRSNEGLVVSFDV